jgi:membrane protease YdiL (CAAX protease family)
MELVLLNLASLTFQVALIFALKMIGVNAGHAGITEVTKRFKKEPIKCAWSVLVMAPFMEEAAFRMLPSVHLDQFTPDVCWSLGAAIAAVFAVCHGLRRGGKWELPVPQFVSGLFYWWVMRTHGIVPAIALHAMTNSLATGALFLRFGLIRLKWSLRKKARALEVMVSEAA